MNDKVFCPWCGREMNPNVEHYYVCGSDKRRYSAQYQCDCGARGTDRCYGFTTEDEAIEAARAATIEPQTSEPNRCLKVDELIEMSKHGMPVYVIEAYVKGTIESAEGWALLTEGVEPEEGKPFNYPCGVLFNAVNANGEILDGDLYGLQDCLCKEALHPMSWKAFKRKPTAEEAKDMPWEGEARD